MDKLCGLAMGISLKFSLQPHMDQRSWAVETLSANVSTRCYSTFFSQSLYVDLIGEVR